MIVYSVFLKRLFERRMLILLIALSLTSPLYGQTLKTIDGLYPGLDKTVVVRKRGEPQKTQKDRNDHTRAESLAYYYKDLKISFQDRKVTGISGHQLNLVLDGKIIECGPDLLGVTDSLSKISEPKILSLGQDTFLYEWDIHGSRLSCVLESGSVINWVLEGRGD